MEKFEIIKGDFRDKCFICGRLIPKDSLEPGCCAEHTKKWKAKANEALGIYFQEEGFF
jgi:hypothetical protein